MYVRFNSPPVIKGQLNGATRHKASLYKSDRVDGKIKQRFIAYLGVYSMFSSLCAEDVVTDRIAIPFSR